jgi:hypothetical protein
MWVFGQQFLLIPHSFMTFVMRKEVRWDDDCYVFDLDQYNFLF